MKHAFSLIQALFLAFLVSFAPVSLSAAPAKPAKSAKATKSTPSKKSTNKKKQSDKKDDKTTLTDKDIEKMSRVERIKSASAALKDSTAALKKGQFATALAHCKNAQRFTPNEKSIDWVCIQLMYKNNEFQDALDTLQSLISNDPDSFNELCYFKSTVEFQLGRFDDASKTLQSCPVRSNKEASLILTSLAEIEMINLNLDKALEIYIAAVKEDNTNPHAVFGATVAAFRANRRSDAQKLFYVGLIDDPDLRFMDNAFFVPEGEPLFHRAILDYYSHRLKSAAYELEKYIAIEKRTTYREVAQTLLEELKRDTKNQPLATWPVLLAKVDLVAYRKGYAAFADKLKQEIWILDTERAKVSKRVSTQAPILGMAFDKDTGYLLAMTSKRRYAFDPQNDQGLVFYYDQYDDDLNWLSLSTDGKTIYGKKGEEFVSAPFYAPVDAKTYIPETIEERLIQRYTRQDGQYLFVRTRNGDLSAVGLDHGTLLLDKEGAILARIATPQDLPLTAIAFDQTGKYLIVVTGMLAELWNVDDLIHVNMTETEEFTSS